MKQRHDFPQLSTVVHEITESLNDPMCATFTFIAHLHLHPFTSLTSWRAGVFFFLVSLVSLSSSQLAGVAIGGGGPISGAPSELHAVSWRNRRRFGFRRHGLCRLRQRCPAHHSRQLAVHAHEDWREERWASNVLGQVRGAGSS